MNDPVEGAAVARINKGIPRIVEDIAQVHRITAAKDHGGVAGGVRGTKVHQINSLTIEVELHGVVIGNIWPGALGVGFLVVGNVHQIDNMVLLHHLSRILLGDQPGAIGT